jgi:hypothetical protein
MKGRDPSSFFLHGGNIPGSAGCIDCGSYDKEIFKLILLYNKPIPVRVNYPASGPPKIYNKEGIK